MMLRKLIRTMALYRAQFLSMIIMVSIGIGLFFGFNIEWCSLEQNMSSFFNATGFADYRIVSERGFSQKQLARIKAIPGVKNASRFISFNVDVVGTDNRLSGDILSINTTENPEVSGFLLQSGEAYRTESKDGIWLSDRYAEANGLSVGDKITISYHKKERTGTIRGLIKSGEYLLCITGTSQLMPDYNTYGFAYISPIMLENMTGMKFYSQINVLSDLDKKSFSTAVDDALHDTARIIAKNDVPSYSETDGEIEEGKIMANFLPVIFLMIAFLTMVTTMHRIAASEKTQIGTLKSLGFKNHRILLHYVSYAVIIGITGTLFGIALGWLIGWYIMNPNGAMGTYLDFPAWDLTVPGTVFYILLVMNIIIVLIGYISVRRMLRGTAADALRPYIPKKMRSIWFERFKFWKRFAFGTRWNLRDTFRHKARTGMSLLGITGCMLIMVASFGMNDTMIGFLEYYYGGTLRYENRINLDTQKIQNGAARTIARQYEGDWSATDNIQIDAESYQLEIYEIQHDLVRFLQSGSSDFIPLPDSGVLICRRIARIHGLAVGDSFDFSPFGTSDRYTVQITGIMQSLSKSVVMSRNYADKLGIDYRIGTIYTGAPAVSADRRIENSQTKSSVIGAFDTFMQVMNLFIALLVGFAAVLGVVVLYNLGIMSYTERYREMATLKVIGFKDRKIRRILIGQNVWLTLVGIVIGIPLGVFTLYTLIDKLAGEYELTPMITWRSYVYSTLLTFCISLTVGFLLSLKNRSINMVEAMKVQE